MRQPRGYLSKTLRVRRARLKVIFGTLSFMLAIPESRAIEQPPDQRSVPARVIDDNWHCCRWHLAQDAWMALIREAINLSQVNITGI